ncbi:MAG: amidohydrolase family protein [Candidatus Wallbacteria bacterium]|nr:amidohydrolase family protein [Candidatus Wallbacteria bacterium]
MRASKSLQIGLAALLTASAFARAAEPPASRFALVGGKVVTMAGRTYDPGRVLVENQTIVAVGGAELDVPPRFRTIDAAGAWVIPGLIDSGTHLGLIEVDLEDQTNDLDDSMDLLSPHLRVVDAVNPASELIRVSRLTGVTTVLVAPGEGDVFSGQAAVLDLAGESVEEMTVRAPAMLCLGLGSDAVNRGRARSRFSTRMGLIGEIRAQLLKVQEYLKKQEKYRRKLEEHKVELASWEASQKPTAPVAPTAAAVTATQPPAALAGKEASKRPEPPDEPERDLKLEALAQVLERKLPLLVRAHRQDDIRAALRLADEFKLKLVINHGTEAYRVAELLAKKDVPVIVGPVDQQPDTFETLGARYENAELLRKAGVRIAIQTSDSHNVRNLPYAAGLAAAHGLPPEEALAAVTIEAAKILGIADKYGSLDKGKIANIAVVEGDPLQPASRLRHLFIRGKSIPLTSRQTELYEKWKAGR